MKFPGDDREVIFTSGHEDTGAVAEKIAAFVREGAVTTGDLMLAEKASERFVNWSQVLWFRVAEKPVETPQPGAVRIR